MPDDVQVSADELRSRTILRADLVPDTAAFLDTKIPGSETKINYPLIGPGVSENGEQVVPVNVPHGFNLGGAVMPAGTINNLHLHYTAEVFFCFAGEWTFRWGVGGRDGEGALRASRQGLLRRDERGLAGSEHHGRRLLLLRSCRARRLECRRAPTATARGRRWFPAVVPPGPVRVTAAAGRVAWRA